MSKSNNGVKKTDAPVKAEAFIPCSILFIELCEGFEAARKREIYFKSFRVGRWDYP